MLVPPTTRADERRMESWLPDKLLQISFRRSSILHNGWLLMPRVSKTPTANHRRPVSFGKRLCGQTLGPSLAKLSDYVFPQPLLKLFREHSVEDEGEDQEREEEEEE